LPAAVALLGWADQAALILAADRLVEEPAARLGVAQRFVDEFGHSKILVAAALRTDRREFLVGLSRFGLRKDESGVDSTGSGESAGVVQKRVIGMDEADDTVDDVDWVAVRRDYEAGVLTRNSVAIKYGIARAQVELRAKVNKWKRPYSDITDRRILIFKLLALLERQIDQVDEQMRAGESREVKVLTDMVRDLDKLIAIEKAEASQQEHETESKEMQDLQRKLEKRINAITKA
jgi:hypothetical protein